MHAEVVEPLAEPFGEPEYDGDSGRVVALAGGGGGEGDVEDQMILFVVLRESLTDELSAEIRRRVREHCSPRHIPDRIVQIDEVPRTLSNKKLEVPVKKILLGAAPESAASRDSLANPDALDWIAEFNVRAS